MGKHVVVVGATGVLGARIAAHLAAAGARVSAIVRDHTRLDGASVFQYALADVTDIAALRLAFASVATTAPIDGVVNATGVVAFGGIGELDDATLAKLLAVNATAPIAMLRESATLLNDGGFFVNISGVVATQPVAGMAAYSASKAAAWAAMS
ncbi:MAG: SDR family NAD(P)-dependent oxidoreductase, partial [Actinobacteria bacterium]|nr:SDR family NAD(P)-dependent oxidoreductase [Actinomycetota bacterium]